MTGGMPVTVVLFNLVRKKVLVALFRLQDRPVGLESNQTTTNLKRCVYVLMYTMLALGCEFIHYITPGHICDIVKKIKFVTNMQL